MNQTNPLDLNSAVPQRVRNESDTSPRDGDHVDAYLLEDARNLYQDVPPPFVSQKSRRRSYQGNRVVVVLATNDGRRPNASIAEEAEVVCHAWDAKHVFWTLHQGGTHFIVVSKGAGSRARGAAYRIWRGPHESFDKDPVAFSPEDSRHEKGTHVDEEAEQPNQEFPPEQSNSSYEICPHLESYTRRRHSRQAKDTGSAKIKHLATEEAKRDRKLKRQRDRRRLRALREQNPNAQPKPNINTPSAASLVAPRSCPIARSPSSSSSDTPLARSIVKSEKNSSPHPRSSSNEPSRPDTQHRARSPSVIEVHHTHNPAIDHYKQSHTTMYVSLSTNNYGDVAVYLRSCLTVESFFTEALSAWGLQDQEDKVAAVAVTFDWLKEDRPMVVRKGKVESFQKMLEKIVKAPVWGAVGEKECDVRVKIIMG